jgi:hypothetical protein
VFVKLVNVTDNKKDTSFQISGIYYDRKKFFDTGPDAPVATAINKLDL